MNYTTIENVRFESGLAGNQNISDADIERYIEQAHSRLVLNISKRYEYKSFTTARVQGSETEKYLSMVETKYSAGLVLINQYGTQDLDGGDSRGTQLLSMAEGLVSGLLDNNPPLTDINGDIFPTNNVGSIPTPKKNLQKKPSITLSQKR